MIKTIKIILSVLVVLFFVYTFIPDIFNYGFFRWLALELNEPVISALSQ